MNQPHSSHAVGPVRRVVTPAQAGLLDVAGAGTAVPAARVQTPAQKNAEISQVAADTVTAIPGVVRVVSPFAAAHAPRSLSDRRIEIRGETMRVSVVIDGQRPIPEVEREVRSAVARHWDGGLDLVFADLEFPGERSDEGSGDTNEGG